MSFQFISGHVGPKERRIIRSHVMVGKNAGRARPSRRNQRIGAPEESTSDCIKTQRYGAKPIKLKVRDCNRPILYDRLICNDLVFTQIPTQSAESIELLRQWLNLLDRRLYPENFCSKLDFMNYVWLQYVFYDEGYMHGVLAIKASFHDTWDMDIQVSSNTLVHLSKAYQITQKRLDGPNAASDVAIAGVTILAIYQLVHGHIKAGLVHFNGLCRMIEMRGGLEKLMMHNRALAQKPWRIDLEFALQSGLPMRFSRAEVNIADCYVGAKIIHPIYTELYKAGVNVDLIGILSDASKFTHSLNAVEDNSRLDPLDFSEQAFSIIHRLIDFAPLRGPRPSNSIEDLLQLALLAIMTTSLPNYTTDELRYELLAEKLKAAIQRCTNSSELHMMLLVWAVFSGRVSILHIKHDEWVIPMIRGLCQRLHINSWLQIRRILRSYSWIYVIHDKTALQIWERTAWGEGITCTNQKTH